jgi:FixJ family two-component response regulator
MRLKETELAEAGTILIAVGDAVLADSLRFSLEIEGFEAKFCDELSLPSALVADELPGCLVIDQDVFTRIVNGSENTLFARHGVPVVLMVGHKTDRVVARAIAAGVTRVVEKPLLGPVLFDAIRNVLDR